MPHVVFSSVGGAERKTGIPHFESKRRVEEHLEQTDLHTTFIRRAFFTDNFAFMGPSRRTASSSSVSRSRTESGCR